MYIINTSKNLSIFFNNTVNITLRNICRKYISDIMKEDYIDGEFYVNISRTIENQKEVKDIIDYCSKMIDITASDRVRPINSKNQ